MDILIVALVLIVMLGLLIKDVVLPSIAFLLALAVLTLAGMISVGDAFKGFGDPSIVTIASLFIIAHGTQAAFGASTGWINKLLGNGDNHRRGLARIMAPVAVVSSFVNNTPVVAMLIEPIIDWANRHGTTASRYLIPVSYAAIFGGTLTLIGTSTNLVVSGVLSSSGYAGFSFFEFTRISAPIAVVGISLVIWLTPKLLRDRHLSELSSEQVSRDYTINMQPKPELFGQTVKQAELRQLDQVFLTSITRKNGDIIAPVTPRTIIRGADVLHFSGDIDSLSSLTQLDSLSHGQEEHVLDTGGTTYFEAVVGRSPNLINKTLKSLRFRSKYQAAVLATFRSGKRVETVSSTRLMPGDTLLLVSDDGFQQRWGEHTDFLYIRTIGETDDSTERDLIPLAITYATIAALLVADSPLAVTFMFGALMMILFNTLTISQAKNAINFDLLIMLGAAIGVAGAVEDSGLAELVTTNLVEPLGALGAIGILVGIVAATAVLTELITNAAAALLVMPIALSVAESTGIDPRALAIAVALTASLSFISPIGYQTNTMVYSTGGYKFQDFLKIGFPVALVSWTMLIALIWLFYDIA